MLERRSGAILNFSSTAGYNGVVRKTHYVTAKASLRAITKTVALEVGQYGIRCKELHSVITSPPEIVRNRRQVGSYPADVGAVGTVGGFGDGQRALK